MQKLFSLIIFSLFLALVPTTHAFGQELPVTESEKFESNYLKGKVIDIKTNDKGFTQYITVLKNKKIVPIDTYGEVVPVGSTIFVEYFPNQEMYNFVTVSRNKQTLFLVLLFVGAILLLTQKKGIRSLGSLALSMALLFGGLIPLLVKGYNPLFITALFGFCVLSLSIFLTHGFNRQSLVSFLGSLGSILLAIGLLEIVTHTTFLTGLISEEIQLLSFEAESFMNLVQIVSASIIIGILGVLDDITITQVAVVRELSTNEKLSRKDIFIKALNVGKDHISALVNTLVFAYIGAALPMIMFISLLDIPFFVLISQEFIFIEIIRSLIGAIALTLAVPVTTWLASFVFLEAIHKDACTIESACAHHHH
jgi:uncharacterized membrane protein